LHDPGNRLKTEGELVELDKETTATFCDDKDEYLLPGPLDSIGCNVVSVKSPTDDEHLLDIIRGEFPPPMLHKIPFGTHFTFKTIAWIMQ
jgi:hypothetical protein